jgi:hypothetical protein
MTKKDFVLLADTIKAQQLTNNPFSERQLTALADMCQKSNPKFNRTKWFLYIRGVRREGQ